MLADVVEALEDNPRDGAGVMSQEVLAKLEAGASETWRRVRAWCELHGVHVVATRGRKAGKSS